MEVEDQRMGKFNAAAGRGIKQDSRQTETIVNQPRSTEYRNLFPFTQIALVLSSLQITFPPLPPISPNIIPTCHPLMPPSHANIPFAHLCSLQLNLSPRLLLDVQYGSSRKHYKRETSSFPRFPLLNYMQHLPRKKWGKKRSSKCQPRFVLV